MNNRTSRSLIAGTSGGVAGGVAAAIGNSCGLPAWQYIVIAMVVGGVMPFILSILLAGTRAKEQAKQDPR